MAAASCRRPARRAADRAAAVERHDHRDELELVVAGAGDASAPIGVWQPPPSASTSARSASSAALAPRSLIGATAASHGVVVRRGSRWRRCPGPAPGRRRSSGSANEIRDVESEPAQAGRRQHQRIVARRRRACAAACRGCRGSASNARAGKQPRQLRDAPHAARADRRRPARAQRVRCLDRRLGDRPRAVRPTRAARPRRADPRAAARRRSSRPSGSTAGMSLLLWTARSISPRSSASSISLTNSRLPPTSDSGASCSRSPDVLMMTIRQGGPPASAMRAATALRLPQRELAAARAERSS